MRYKLLGSKPITSMRGVATCVWNINPHTVLIPDRWMRNVKVPYRKRSDSNVQSPSFIFRPVQDGDYAVLLCCPIVSDMSVQPVTVLRWNSLSVGVHPEMCRPLNLDYDGDEVHVIILSSPESRDELLKSISSSTLNKFSEYSPRVSCTDRYVPDENKGVDFMVGTTLSISEGSMSN